MIQSRPKTKIATDYPFNNTTFCLFASPAQNSPSSVFPALSLPQKFNLSHAPEKYKHPLLQRPVVQPLPCHASIRPWPFCLALPPPLLALCYNKSRPLQLSRGSLSAPLHLHPFVSPSLLQILALRSTCTYIVASGLSSLRKCGEPWID